MRFGVRGRILLFFAAIAAGSVLVLIIGLWFGYHRNDGPGFFSAFLQAGIATGFGLLALVSWMWFLFDRHIAQPIEGVASAIRASAHAEVAGDIDIAGARHLGDLPAAASSAVATLKTARDGLAETVARETSQLLADKRKLEQMLADVPPAVLLCTAQHHLAFYNSAAQQMFSGSKLAVCLDRSLFDYLDDGAIRLAHQRLVDAKNPDAIIEFVCPGPASRQRLAGRMRLSGDNNGDPGAYVLTLRDVTDEIASLARRDRLLRDVFAATRIAITAHTPPAGAPGPEAWARLPRDLEILSRKMDDLELHFRALRADDWPMANVDALDLAHRMQRQFAAASLPLDVEAARLSARCNAVDIISLFAHLGRRVAATRGTLQFRFSIFMREDQAVATLSWPGSVISRDELAAWLVEPLHEDGLSADMILASHGTDIVCAAAAGAASLSLCMPLVEARCSDQHRSVTYDFSLLSRAGYDHIADARLDDLTYVVFDTETTGLLPDRGDELVQIAAVRIVNGKTIKSETFETLVNPGRTIPPSSSAIHRITDAMVADAPSVLDVVERFHKFAANAILVAHNASFDMAFLHRREKALGIQFDHPVLDTALLSAVAFGQQESHTLDAIASRLAIALPKTMRHTAMGDAVATAEAFVKLKAILAARGCERFGDLLRKTRGHDKMTSNLHSRLQNRS